MTRVVSISTFVFLLISVSANLFGQAYGPRNGSNNTTELTKLNDIPVSLYTGTPQISIPLGSIQGTKLSVPISLSYNAQGIRVDQTATWVGLGWNLEAGGVVSISARGDNDVTPFSMYHGPGQSLESSQASQASIDVLKLTGLDLRLNQGYNVYRFGGQGLEPDIINYSMPGRSGKCVFGLNGEIFSIPFNKVRFEFLTVAKYTYGEYPCYNINGQPDGMCMGYIGEHLTSFVVVYLEDGSIYVYGGSNPDGSNNAVEETVSYIFRLTEGRNVNTGITPNYAWYLRTIISPDRSETIQFNYENYGNGYNLSPKYYASTGAAFKQYYNQGPFNEEIDEIQLQVSRGVRLREIRSSNEKAMFTTSDRVDVPTGDKKLDLIDFFNNKGEKHKIISLNYTYSSNSNPCTYSQWSIPLNDDSRRKRLILQSVNELNGASVPIAPPYVFSYYRLNDLPVRHPYQQDSWGFYNPSSQILRGAINQSKSSIDPEASRIGVLNSISYPTGAVAQFNFEVHRGKPVLSNGYIDPNESAVENCGGLRIASILHHPNGIQDDKTITKRYLYEYLSGGSSGYYQQFERYYLNDHGQIGMVNSVSVIPTTHGSSVGYSEVQEHTSSALGQNGIVTYKYTNLDNGAYRDIFCNTPPGTVCSPSIPGRVFPTNMDHLRGLLVEKSAYKNSLQLQAKEVYIYENQLYNSLTSNQKYSLPTHVFHAGGCMTYGCTGFSQFTATYSVRHERIILSSVRVTQYDDNGTPLPEVTTSYFYDNLETVPTAITTSYPPSLGINDKFKLIRYAYQYSTQAGGGALESALVRMRELGMRYIPIETIEGFFKHGTCGVPNQPDCRNITNATLNLYELQTVNNAAIPLLKNVLSFVTNSTVLVPNFQQFGKVNGAFVYDSRYRVDNTIEAYNSLGQPTRTNDRFRVPSSVRYGYNNTRVVANVKNGTLSNWLSDASAGYLSFEEPAGTGSFMQDGEEWFNNFSNTRVWHSDAFTGRYVLRAMSGPMFEKPYLPTNQSGIHVFLAWVRASRPVQLSMYVSAATDPTWWNRYAGTPGIITFSRSTKTDNSWELVTVRLDLNKVRTDYNIPGGVNLRVCVGIGTVDNTSSEVLVDEVRFMALDAAMATTTYDDFGRVLDQTDAANNTVRYQYDNFGRLEYTWSYDLDGKKRVLERNRIMYHTDPVNRIWNPGRPINRVTKQTALEDVESIAAFNALNLDQRAEQQQFLDGLGRPIQSVDVRSTPLKQDVFQHIAYDSRGLSPRTFLPYVRWMPAEWDANNTERLDPDPLGTLTNYYGGSFQGYGEGVAKDAKPWSDATFEASPAARVLSQGMLGTNWNGKTSTVTTRLNNTTDDVIRFVVHRPAGWVYDMMNPVGSWPAGSLLVQRSVDVDGRAKETFTNLEGQMVLSRVLHRNPPNGTDLNHPSNWAETYYCYDDFGRLCFVFQPEGVNRIRTVNPPHWPYNNYEMSAYLFIYRYDQFGRIVEKCTPGVPKDGSTWGGNTEYIVYNPADMPIAIMTDRGDARTVNGTRQREWSFITYDALGRKARTGLWHDLWDPNRGRAQLQAYVDADLAPTHKPLHESRRFNSNGVHYTRNFFDGGSTELAWSIYDDYDANLDGADDVTLVPNADYGGTLMLAPRHLPTLSYTRVLGTTTFLQSAVGYDLRGRVCQTRETTYLGGFIQTHLKYNTRGEVSHKLITNKRSSNTGDPEYSFEQQQSYDHRGRLRNLHVKTYQGNNSQNTPNRSFAQYDYNELGQQVRKHLFHTGSAWLQQIDYTYNIQGWLTAINDPYNLSNSKLWGMRLQYETPDAPWWTNAEFGGNISTQTWRANGEPLLHRFFYTYDRMNRLNSAGPGGMGAFYISQAPNGGAWSRAHWYHQPIHDYDRNGNLTRFQLIMGDSVNNGGSLAWVDNFSSAPNQIQLYGNRLWNVRDQGSNNGPHGEFKDNTATAANVAEYGYDPSGNITSDANAGISVEYNHLNLVTKITKGTGTIEYTYAADGTLLARRVNGTLHQEWMGGFVYKQGGVLDYIFTPEGRVVRETSGNFVYEYHYTDQVGSLRLAWQALGNIAQAVEVHNYYPYGVRIPRQHGTPTTAHTYQYRYTGQWNETALGLNYYRFEARLYDPALGRWTGVDPMAAKYQDMSPYNYALGNPVRFIDPDGRDPFDGHYLDDLGAVIPRDSPVWAMRHQNRLDNLGLRSLLLQDDPIKGRNVSKKNVMPTDKSKHFGGADLPSGAEEGDLWFNPALGTFIRANGRWQQFDPKSMRGYESAEHRFITNEQAAVDRRRIQDFSIYLLTEAIGAWVQFARAEVQVARAEAQMARSAYSAEIVTSTTNASITPWPAASGGRTVINGIEYTTHALERMQPVGTILKGNEVYSRGVPPSVVENAIKYGKITPGNTAAEVVRTFENITVVTDIEGKRVITVIKKSIK